jgi:hypothetical protein
MSHILGIPEAYPMDVVPWHPSTLPVHSADRPFRSSHHRRPYYLEYRYSLLHKQDPVTSPVQLLDVRAAFVLITGVRPFPIKKINFSYLAFITYLQIEL